MKHLALLESTYSDQVLRPFSTPCATEIVAAPKVYAFDTGFACYHHEVDLVLARRWQAPLAVECKWSTNDMKLVNLKAFAHQYPKAEIRVEAQDVERPFQKRSDSLNVTYCGLKELLTSVTSAS
jgi:hypothetical protein